MIRLAISLVLLGVLGCGGAQSKAGSSRGETRTSSKEEDCLAAAAAHSEPKPNAPAKISVSHVLVRHADLARPEGASRTRGQACLRALKALNALKDGVAWDEVVEKFSDAPGPNHGALGRVSKEDLDPSFAAVAFSLDVNEISYVVESFRGFHVIIRTE